MGVRRLVSGTGLAVLVIFASLWAAAPSTRAASLLPYNVASDSYYRLDVPNGAMHVTVKATFQNAQSADLPALPFFMMANATNVVVKQDGTTLASKLLPASGPDGAAGVAATLTKPLKSNQKVDLVLTYDVGSQSTTYTKLQPGVTETMFLGQGAGSFVFVDVPLDGDNYFDPGCLKTEDQPADVKSAGFERWVCGDVTLIAINTDHPEVLKRCAELDDKCRQRALPTLFSAFVQSITDKSLSGSLEADVAMQGGTKKLIFKYFRSDETWATHEMGIAKAALPMLEKVFGFPYTRDTIVVRQSHHIALAGDAGVAFPDSGQVLVTPGTGLDDEVMVHELAHQWAGFNLDMPWEWEGLAEYAMRTVAPALGIQPSTLAWQTMPYKDNLALWRNGSLVSNPDYWYGKSGSFWFAYRDAIGGAANMTAVLAQTLPTSKRAPFDAKWFLDAGEAVSGANLDSPFLGWVFNPQTAAAELSARRDAHNLTDALAARAQTLGLSHIPTDIQDNLDAWIFGGISAQVAQAGPILDSYEAVVKLAADASLPRSDAVARAWNTGTMAHTRALIEDQRQAIEALTDARQQLADEPGGSPAMNALSQAHESYSRGEFPAAKGFAADAVTAAYNEIAAAKMIEIAKNRQASYKQSFLGRIGLFRLDPAGDLARAEADYADGKPDSALTLSRSAYDAWDGASSRGLQRLAFVAGAMCALSFAVWWLLRRIDGGSKKGAKKAAGLGHVLESPDGRRQGWRDWENNEHQ